MPAYLIGHIKFRDRSWLRSEYVTVTAKLEEQYGGVHIASGLHEQVEGDQLGTATSIVQFPTMEALRSFWNDPEYQRVAEIRRAGADCDVVLIDAAEIVGPFAPEGPPQDH